MSKVKVYKVSEKNKESDSFKWSLIEFLISLILYAVILLMASNIFKGMYIENFVYALIAALIISMLNFAVKPLLVFLTLPLNILTFGITYPLVNVIILKLCSMFMGDKFLLEGFLSSFFIAIFISFMKILFDNLITNKIGGSR